MGKRTLSLVLLTYNRYEYARPTLWSTLSHLRLEGDLHVHIADDGSPDDYVTKLVDTAANFSRVKSITTSDSKRGGYGMNYNLAMQVAHERSDFILPLEDDWELTRELDVNRIMDDMDELALGCARLGYIGFTQNLRASFAHAKNGMWLEFDPKSPEPHVFAGHPRIETVEWAREVGPWPEGLEPGDTEFAVAHRKDSRYHVGWPIDYVKPCGDLFAHIGSVRSY